MFDIRWIRDNPEAFDAALQKRGLDPLAARLLDLDEKRRAHVTALQELQQRRNSASKEIGAAKKAKDEARAATLMAEVGELKDKLSAGEEQERELTRGLERELAVIPNMPLDEVPVGRDEHDNKEVRKVGTPPTFAFKPKQHFEIGEALGLMDFETAGKVSGARFVYLKGQLARLERAIAQFMLDLHTEEFGYTEVNPPILTRDDAMYGTAQLPKFAEDLFQTGPSLDQLFDTFFDIGVVAGKPPKGSGLSQLVLTEDEISKRYETLSNYTREQQLEVTRSAVNKLRSLSRFWLIPTAEVPLTNLVREEILPEDRLPVRFTAWTPCFRSEAGAAGKDTRGMIRQHQFSKVELVSITSPEQSLAEHERMTNCAEEVLKRLGLAYRTMLLCTGDMGFASQKTYDIEVWLPGQDTYREISSCSVCGDFQARRMNARFRPKDGKGPVFVHTLNGSGLAVGRTLISIIENYQQADGSVVIPDALKPYMGGRDTIVAA